MTVPETPRPPHHQVPVLDYCTHARMPDQSPLGAQVPHVSKIFQTIPSIRRVRSREIAISVKGQTGQCPPNGVVALHCCLASVLSPAALFPCWLAPRPSTAQPTPPALAGGLTVGGQLPHRHRLSHGVSRDCKCGLLA